MFGADLVILAQTYDELSRGQAEFPKILSQIGQNGLEGQGPWPLFSVPAEGIRRGMFGANLVILDQICDELSYGQGKVCGPTYGRTDRRRKRQNYFGLKGQGVKKWIPYCASASGIHLVRVRSKYYMNFKAWSFR